MPTANVANPKIDQYAAQRVLASRMMNNVVQSLIHRNDLGITEAFSDNVMAAQVRIIRQKLPTQTSRTMGSGSGYNDSHFNVMDPEQPITQEYSLSLIEMFDRNIDVADVLDDMIAIGVLNVTVKTLEQRLAQIINAYTMAVKIAAALTYDNTQSGGELIVFNPLTDSFTTKLAEAHAKLDEGATAHGIDTFPQENRIVLTNTKGKYELLTVDKSVYNVGASRGIELLEIGSAGKLQRAPETNVTGYFGELYNTPLHMAAPILFTIAEQYLGLHAGALDLVYGIASASQATGRGVAFQGSIKIIDNPRGQGVRLQPKTRWGVANWIPQGERLIVRLGFHNPLDGTEVTALTVAGTDSADATSVPNKSTYNFFDFDMNDYTFTADASLEGLGTTIQLKSALKKLGTAGYDHIRTELTVVEKPGGSTLELYWDTVAGAWEMITIGYIGAPEGNPISANADTHTTPNPVALRATHAGIYKVKAEVVDKDDDDAVLGTKIISFYVNPA